MNRLPSNPADRLAAEHTAMAIRARLQAGSEHSYLRDFVFGAIDGAVTTFAVVSGVTGAGLASEIIIILGVANLVGDGFSMAAGSYLATRSEQQLRDRARRTEEEHIRHFPEGEREEIRQIFAAKGFDGPDLDRVVEVITSNRRLWVDTMLREELGMSLEGPSPIRAALSTFAAFMLVGALPLLAFVYNWFIPAGLSGPFLWSTLLTGVAFFVVGALKARFVGQRWYWSGLETLVVGGAAAALAFGIGLLLKGVGVAG